MDKNLLRSQIRDESTADEQSENLEANDDSERTQAEYEEERREQRRNKKLKRPTKEESKAQEALAKKLTEFNDHKGQVPKPTIIHDKQEVFTNDIIIPSITLIAGGKVLLENATLRLVQGRKYGLVGRNGIGKTTLVNAISKKELDDFPQDLHILQVEQEVEADDISVLQHLLNCDEEREKLLKEQIDLQ